MKKRLMTVVVLAALLVLTLASCGSNSASTSDEGTLTCLADTTPHKEILEHAADMLAEEGITLDIVSETWDETWNEQVENGTVDFHYDAYVPYLDEWNEANDGHLVAATGADEDNGGIHIEPLVMMSDKYDNIDDVPDNAKVAVKNDVTNEYRCLKLLEKAGWIELSDELTLSNASVDMITKYNKPLEIVELDADVIMQDRQDFDVYLTNTNRLLDAEIDPTEYLIREDTDGSLFANVIAINEENKDNENIKKLVEVLQSDEMRDWINSNYDGAIVAAF